MIAADEDALICDLAETYRVYDYRSLPVRQAAILAWGLSEDSRIKRRLIGAKARQDTLLLAAIMDRLSMLVWLHTEDGAKGKNRPQLLLEQWYGADWEKPSDLMGFDSGEAFRLAYEKRREEVLKGA